RQVVEHALQAGRLSLSIEDGCAEDLEELPARWQIHRREALGGLVGFPEAGLAAGELLRRRGRQQFPVGPANNLPQAAAQQCADLIVSERVAARLVLAEDALGHRLDE